MANSGQPTNRKRHMDIKHLTIQHWIDTDLLKLERIGTNDNEPNYMIKNTRRTLFYRHLDYLTRKGIPEYAKKYKNLQLSG